MKIAMHQPNFLPWLGFFYKMAKSDLFVIADTLAFSRYSYTQRVKIKTQAGARWLTAPVLHTGKVGQPIFEVKCGGWKDWRERIVDALKGNYQKCPHYQYYGGQIAQIILSGEDNLSRLNIQLITFIAEQLGIKTPIVCSSNMRVQKQDNPTDWIITVCKEVGADTFLSGTGGTKYQNVEAFEKAGIKLIYSDFKHPVYPQLWGEFIPNLSIIDLIFNCGPDSPRILLSKNR